MTRLLPVLMLFPFLFMVLVAPMAQPKGKIRKADLRKDILVKTDSGNMVLRLNDSTPLHRDNFIRLVKSDYYKGIGFHRVISRFMIQAGDEKTKPNTDTSSLLKQYTLPAEIRPELYHRRGVLAAARMGDDVNPRKNSSGTQFYIVQGKIFNDVSLDSVETHRLKGRKLPEAHRNIYKKEGGAPHLDQNYTIFGELISGYDVLDKIANTKTSGRQGGDKPLTDIRIQEMKMVRRIE
jgi:cyclophilin family peptidyl-prolyl cis-trans isomerase